MGSVLPLRDFIRDKLEAAAEEIFTEMEKTIRLLEINLRAQIIQELTELHQQKISKEDVLDDPQFWTSERTNSLDQEEAESPPGHEEVRLPGKQGEKFRMREILGGSDPGAVQMEELDLRRHLLDTSCKAERKSHRSEPPHVPEEVLADREIWAHRHTWSADKEEPEPPWIKQNQEEPEPLWIKQNQEEPGSLHIKRDKEDPEPPWVKQNQEEDCVYLEEERLLIHQNFNPIPSEEESDHSEPEPGLDQVHSETSAESEPSKRTMMSSEMKKSRDEECSSGSESLGGFGPAFSRTSSLMGHSRTSSSEEAFSAGLLGGEPSSSSEPHHQGLIGRGETEASLYSCGSCGKRFRFNCRYLSHLRTHTGEKPFSCAKCGKRFTQGGSLWRHVRTHSGEKPFLCRTCGKSFSQKTGLLVHIRTQHAAGKPCSG